jgi:hypothetical protein
MPKSEFAIGLDEIQKPIAAALKQKGFRKAGRTFNRLSVGGLTHVVNFQMGQYPIGEYVIPGIREDFYGKFAINLGIVLPCIRRIERRWEAKKVYQEYDCEIRQRLGSLAKNGHDVWWIIKPPLAAVASEVQNLLFEFGMPFLDHFSSYEDVTREFETCGKFPFLNEGRSALVAAMIYHDRGNSTASESAFRRAKEYPTKNAGFLKHIQTIENECQQKRNDA